MTKQQLILITLLADGYSISAAARDMRIAQSYASRMLKGLEDQMGIKLVTRRSGRYGGGTEPTPELASLSRIARKILANMKAMADRVEEIKKSGNVVD